MNVYKRDCDYYKRKPNSAGFVTNYCIAEEKFLCGTADCKMCGDYFGDDRIKSKDEMNEELCEFCKITYSKKCEGMFCDEAYNNYKDSKK